MYSVVSFFIVVGIVMWFCNKTKKTTKETNLEDMEAEVTYGIDTFRGLPIVGERATVNSSDTNINVTLKEGVLDTSRLVEYTGEIPRKFEFRPQTFEQFIGQEEAKERAKTIVKKARMGLRSHILIDGIKGHGKTTYAKLIQKQLGGKFIQHIGRQINEDNIIDILNEINTSEEKYVFWFVDELDSMPTKAIKILNPILEEFMLNGKKIKPFIFCGATINKHELIKNNPDTLDRIPFSVKFAKYTSEELLKILKQYYAQLYPDITIPENSFELISINSKFNPRTAISLLDETVVERNIQKVLKNNKIIKDGLTTIDIKILEVLAGVKRMGSNAIAMRLGISEKEYLTEFEGFLVEYDYINRIPSRVITEKGRELLIQIKGGN